MAAVRAERQYEHQMQYVPILCIAPELHEEHSSLISTWQLSTSNTVADTQQFSTEMF